jgi:hypothetical protein
MPKTFVCFSYGLMRRRIAVFARLCVELDGDLGIFDPNHGVVEL